MGTLTLVFTTATGYVGLTLLRRAGQHLTKSLYMNLDGFYVPFVVFQGGLI